MRKAEVKQQNWTVLSSRPAFISGPLLAALMVCLSLSLVLGRAVGLAAAGTRQQKEALEASLAFEETLLRLDLNLPVLPFRQGGFSVVWEAVPDDKGRPALRVRLLDSHHIKEEAWLSGRE